MQLFTTKINDIQSQIEALQAEAAKLQDLENATAGAISNLMAVVANLKDDDEAITTLKSAINNLFQASQNPEITDEQEDEDEENSSPENKQEPEFGTAEKPCPATLTGECANPECEGETFTCEGCGKETPYCFGGDGDELCNDCWNESQKINPIVLKEPIQDPAEEEIESSKVAVSLLMDDVVTDSETIENSRLVHQPDFKKAFDSEPDPDEFGVVVYSDRVHRYENQIGIHFKLKREAKAWADQFEVKYHDCKIEIYKDDFESFGYVLKMTKGNPDNPQWWKEVTSFDYSKSPAENRQREKYHVLIQNQGESETVEIESSDEAVARKNYQHLVESIPYAYIHLMTNKRGCIESHKPAVQQTLPDEVADESDEPAFSFMATGQGWLKVSCEGNVLGPIYSNPSGWELENGDQFETREEAAQALFNSTPSAA